MVTGTLVTLTRIGYKERLMSGIIGVSPDMRSGVVGLPPPSMTKLLQITRTYTEGGGSESITGVGFSPSAIIVVGASEPVGYGVGIGSVTTSQTTNTTTVTAATSTTSHRSSYDTDWGRYEHGSDAAVFRDTAGSYNRWAAHLTSLDADGATFSFTEYDTNNINLILSVLFIR